MTKLFIQGSGENGDGEGGPAQDHLQRNGQGVNGLRAGIVLVLTRTDSYTYLSLEDAMTN